MISNLDALTARLEAERRGHGRVYRVGATPNPALRLIPAAYMSARKTFPNLVVELVEGSTDDLLLALRRGEYSLVLGRSSPQDSLSAIKQTPLYPEVGVIVGRAGHPATGSTSRAAWSPARLPVGPPATWTDPGRDRPGLHACRMQSALPVLHQLCDPARLRRPGALGRARGDAARGGESGAQGRDDRRRLHGSGISAARLCGLSAAACRLGSGAGMSRRLDCAGRRILGGSAANDPPATNAAALANRKSAA